MAADVFTWSGHAGDHQYNNPANWVDAVVPPNNGTATLVFGNAQDIVVTLPFSINVAQIQFQNTASTPYTFNTQFLTFITLSGGITSTTGGTQRIGDDITLNLTGPQNFNITSGTLELAGGIMGSGSIVKTGAGNLRLDTFSLFTGNTQVENGALIYANSLALPFSGTISASSTSYVGAENASTLKSMLGYLDAATFRGAIGLGTAPGIATTTYTDQIDVSNLSQYAGLGSTTSARLIGNIKVGANQDYRFSGGAGTLYVGTNLTNQSSGLLVNSLFGQPLTVVLQGSNSFGGNANVLNSVLVLDSQQAVTAGKILNIAGPGYAGATERFASTSTSSFLSLINATSPNAIAGFDSTNLAAPRTITEAIDLSVGGTRNDPYYLGTSSKVTLTGKLTPTVGDSLYLTAVKGGHLVIGSTLGNNIPGLVVGQANSFDPQGGIVEITGRNNYTGGTKILGGTLRVSNDAALGTGSVDVGTKSTLDLSTGTTLTNSFSLASGARLSGNGAVGTPGGAYFGPGAILSPGGANAIGKLTFNTGVTFGSGSVFEFNIGNLNGGPGTGWDLVNANGLLNLAAFSNSPITLDLNTLSSTGAPGLLSGFNANQSYSWLFLSAGNIAGFSSDKFSFNTTDFANSLGNGNFFVTQSNTGLSINFAPVPEPGTYLLFAVGLGVVAILELRRRKT